MNKINILIADDHRIFAEGLESILSQVEDIHVLGIAKNGNHLLSLLHAHRADVVLLDISMPELDGFETASRILSSFPHVKIIILTMHNTEQHIIPMIQLGVQGYILKNSGRVEVLKSIYSVIDSGQYFSSEISERIAAAKKVRDNKVTFSEREKEILHLVYEGFSTQKISEKLFISPRTVETHRRNLANKTDSRNTAQLIHYAIENDLLKNDRTAS